jgi:glucose/arabinose dehydrogenase
VTASTNVTTPRTLMVPLAVLLIGAILAGQGAPVTSRPVAFYVQLLPLPTQYRAPVFAADPGDGTHRLFIVEKRGVIKPVINGEPSVHPFLDIRDLVRATGAEQGLLSLAFHPQFRTTRAVFLAYTDNNDDLVVAKYLVSSRDPNRADPASAQILLTATKRYPDHNGGLVRFGPDGYLYIGIGDGGVGAEPDRNAQRLDTLLGKILRIDVDQFSQDAVYGIPPDNPFVDVEGARPEIWAYGLRNPWRFAFDHLSGDLYVADVGFGGPEEINVQRAGQAGSNFGWNVFEGPRCYRAETGASCSSQGMTAPVWSYEHPENGCAVVGGHVYRGTALPELRGAYLFADHCSGIIWAMRQVGEHWRVVTFVDTGLMISSFAENAQGELYILDLKGTVFRMAPGSASAGVRVVA